MMQRYNGPNGEVEAGMIQGTSSGGTPEVVYHLIVGGQQYEPLSGFTGVPLVGDYLIRAADGSLSWVEAAVFIRDYTLVEDAMGGTPSNEVSWSDMSQADKDFHVDWVKRQQAGSSDPSGDVTLPIEAAKLGAKGFGSKPAEDDDVTGAPV